MKTKRILSLILAVCIVLSVMSALSFTASAAVVETAEVSANVNLAETGANYGLAKNIQDGNILHCFDWKYNDIKAELKNIAEAGFTSVQTSPAQPGGSGEWYWLYQPYGFYVGTNPLGSKSDLQSLCNEAEKYGIKVIVDVVANHLNGDTNRVQDDLKDNQYWHTLGTVSNWADRFQVTHGEIGMRDLNSEHSYVQQVVAKYMKELEAIGVDGIRWDAAKHISLPSEGCQFWPAVTKNNGMWHYGEILVGPDDRSSGNEGLMKEYTNYMSVTDSPYGSQLRDSFNGGNAPGSHGNWCSRGIDDNKLVYWGESHDTYSNGAHEWGASTNMNQNTIDRAYAVAASRKGANALYFSRPSAKDKGSIHSGQKGSTSFKNKEVAAVNQLKNACVGEKDYYQNSENCAVISRESGAVIVLGSGSNRQVTVANGGGTTKPGTYKDLVSGSTWTVTNSTMSGQVGNSGIAVLLNATPKPVGPSAYATPGSTNYTTTTFPITLNYENATSGQYSVNGGAYQNFTNGQKITIGKGTAFGSSVTLSVKAFNGNQVSEVQIYKYSYSVPAPDGIYFDNNDANWGKVYCYIYKDGANEPAKWPGTEMKNDGDGIWSIKAPSGFENCLVIFNDGNGNQTPGSGEPGVPYSGGGKIFRDGAFENHSVAAPEEPETQPVIKPTEATKPTQKPTQAPTTQAPVTQVPTQKPTQAPTTQAPTQKPTQAPTKPIVTDPQETTEDLIIIVPPSPTKPHVTKPQATDPVEKPITTKTKYLYGDVDMDDKVSIKDSTAIQKILSKFITFNELQMILGDVNGSNTISIADATAIQKMCANMLSEFKVGKWYIVEQVSTEAEKPQPTKAPTKPQMTDPVEKPTQAPTTQAPTQAPTTQAPTQKPTQVPTTQVPTTQAPTTQAPTTQAPVTEPETEPTQAPVYTDPVDDGKINIYFKNEYNWGDVRAHYWNQDGSVTTVWPGEAMTSVGDGYFKITIDKENVNIIFSDNGNGQTADLSIAGSNKCFYIGSGQWNDYAGGNNENNNNNNNNNLGDSSYIYFKDTNNWGNAYCHSWSSESGDTTVWPGTQMESVGNGIFRIQIPAGHNKVVFNDGGGRQSGDISVEAGRVFNYAGDFWEDM